MDDPLAVTFQKPFRSTPEIMEEYRAVISTPMDFSTIQSRIKNYHYANYREWSSDMCLVFDNAVAFHGPESVLGGVAVYLKTRFLKRLELLKLSNVRSFEAEVASAGAKLAEVLQRIPDGYGIEYGYELKVPEAEPFTVERFHVLAKDLSGLSERGLGGQIAERLNAVFPGAIEALPPEIEVATLPKRALLALEALVGELEGRESSSNSGKDEDKEQVECLGGPLICAAEGGCDGENNIIRGNYADGFDGIQTGEQD
jgi:hypothetical protein